MPEPAVITALRRELLLLGCPVQTAQRIVRETAEHYDDLQKAARAQGLAPEEAASRASQLMGDPLALARRHIDALRNSSWFGRRPWVGFGIFPAAAMLALALLFWCLGGNRFVWNDPWDVLRNHAVWAFLWMGWIYGASLLAVTALLTFCLCRRVRRLAVPRRWMWVAGGVLAAHGLFVQIQPSHWATLGHGVELKTEKTASPEKPFIMEAALHGADEANSSLLAREYRDGAVLQLVPSGTALPSDYAVVQNPALQNQLLSGLAEIRKNLTQHPPTSLGQLGWGPNWHIISNDTTPGKPPLTTITAYSDASGQLHWAANVVANFPCYAIDYSPAIFAGGPWHWFNVILPLLIVAVMVGWERWVVRRAQNVNHGKEGLLGLA